MKRIFLAMAAIAVLTQTGRADMDWTGPYVGANAGYGWGQASTNFIYDGANDGIFAPSDGGGFNQQMHREVYGVQAGYNKEVWRGEVPRLGTAGVTAGVEVAYDGADIQAKSGDLLNMGEGNNYTTRIYSLASLTPQVGFAYKNWLLRYKIGVAMARVFSAIEAPDEPSSFSQNQEHDGWTTGLGADYALTDHWLAGLSYDYYDLSTKQYGGSAVPDFTYPTSYQVHPVIRTLTARVSYKF